MTDEVVAIVAVLLSLAVLSRVIGDNPVYRVAQYLFVGVSLGLALVVAYHQVLRPVIVALLVDGGNPDTLILYAVPLALGMLLLTRMTPGQELSWLANIPLALMFGVGAALAVGGALLGTLYPQVLDTARPLTGGPADIAGALVLVVGVILGLARFYVTVPVESPRGRLVAAMGRIGHWLIMVTFGFFFAAALTTYLAALTERAGFIIETIRDLIQ